MNWAIERLPSVTSTMDIARQRARAGAPEGTVIVADEMTAGRGTQGRLWAGPKGGLYLSLVLRDLPDPHLLTLALGNAVADALEVAGVEPRLKWVNDVWVQGKKIAGILVEAESIGDRVDFLVAGIGINVNGPVSALSPDVQHTATTLEQELGCDSCIPDLEALVLDSAARWLEKVRAGASSEVIAGFAQRDALQGQNVTVQETGGVVHGVAAGVDSQGRLLVRGATGTQAVFSGHVTLAPPSTRPT